MVTLETDRLILRPFEADDAGALHAAVYGDPVVMDFMPGRGPRLVKQVQNLIDYFTDHWDRFGYGAWALTEKDSGTLIGQCGLNYVADLQETEVLFALAQSAWGRGYATEAAHAALRYGFDKHVFDQIIALVAPENTASQRVIEKLHMQYQRNVKLAKMKLQLYQILRQDYKPGGAFFRIAPT